MNMKKTPQVERGFIQIATGKEENDILMALIKTRLSGGELRLILLVIRKTYGYKKKEDWISLTQFENYLSMTRISICRIINSLVTKKILVKQSIPGVRALYQLNKDFNQWKQLVTKNTLVTKRIITSNILDNQLVTKKLPTKETITKETITKESVYSKLTFLKQIPANDLEELFKRIQATRTQIQEKADDLYNYCQAKGRVYKNYKAFLINALKRDFGVRTIHRGGVSIDGLGGNKKIPRPV